MRELHTSVMLLGAGGGGFGACWELTRRGIPVVIADKNPGFGGTAVYGGVCCWEPGVSLEGVHRPLAEKLLRSGGGQVQKTVPNYKLFCEEMGYADPHALCPDYPWGLSVPCEAAYDSTLKRCRQFRSSYIDCTRFMMDEDALGAAMAEMIAENGPYCTTMFGFEYCGCETDGRTVTAVLLKNGSETLRVTAEYFLDCSGGIVLAQDAGCRCVLGSDDGDPDGINGVSMVFRVSQNAQNALPEPDADWLAAMAARDADWERERMRRVVSCFNLYPNGDINVNMLPTLTGGEWYRLGAGAPAVGTARVWRYWRYMQAEKGLADRHIVKIFVPGIREGLRLAGRKVLTLEDITAPFAVDEHTIAIADHALDTHGLKNRPIGELEHPYAIPLDCTRPIEYDNLFVVCRGASFTHTVASSARLTRTMMSMGEGVAKYIVNTLAYSRRSHGGRNPANFMAMPPFSKKKSTMQKNPHR